MADKLGPLSDGSPRDAEQNRKQEPRVPLCWPSANADRNWDRAVLVRVGVMNRASVITPTGFSRARPALRALPSDKLAGRGRMGRGAWSPAAASRPFISRA